MASLNVGECPCEETCLPNTASPSLQKEQCRRFIEVIRKKCGKEPDGARLFVKRNPYESGDYYSVECEFDKDKPESVKYAFFVEANSPVTWSDTIPEEKE